MTATAQAIEAAREIVAHDSRITPHSFYEQSLLVARALLALAAPGQSATEALEFAAALWDDILDSGGRMEAIQLIGQRIAAFAAAQVAAADERAAQIVEKMTTRCHTHSIADAIRARKP